MLENLHVHHSIMAVFFLNGMVIRPHGICLVLLIIDFISSSSASLFMYSIIITLIGKRGFVYMLLSISELVYLYAPTFVFAHLALCQR